MKRRRKVSEAAKADMREKRANGWTLERISDWHNCSTKTVWRVVNADVLEKVR